MFIGLRFFHSIYLSLLVNRCLAAHSAAYSLQKAIAFRWVRWGKLLLAPGNRCRRDAAMPGSYRRNAERINIKYSHTC